MGGLLGRDNLLGSAFELINKRIEEEAEAEKEKQALGWACSAPKTESSTGTVYLWKIIADFLCRDRHINLTVFPNLFKDASLLISESNVLGCLDQHIIGLLENNKLDLVKLVERCV